MVRDKKASPELVGGLDCVLNAVKTYSIIGFFGRHGMMILPEKLWQISASWKI